MRERHSKMAEKRISGRAKSHRVFGQRRKPAKMLRAGLYARVSTNDQQTIPLQIRALREYSARRGVDHRPAGERSRLGCIATATAGEVAGSGAAPRNRRGAGVAIGSLGPIRHGPADHFGRTGPPRRRFRLSDGSTGPDDTSRASDGWPTCSVCGFRKRDFARTGACRFGSRSAERQETGPAHYSSDEGR
jgi:hypothetical protein